MIRKITSYIFVSFILLIFFFSVNIHQIFAQTVDPSVWQQSAVGLKTSTNNNGETAGLVTTIKVNSGIPFMMLQGGVNDGGWGQMSSTVGIDLGEIKNPGVTSASLTSETSDWSYDEMTFTTNLSNQINVWISRLSPAILIQNSTTSLRLFSGNLSGATFQPGQYAPYTPQITNRTPAPAYPKYVAYSTGGSIKVQQIPSSGSTPLSLPSLDNNWVLIWYGNNSYFTDTRLPLGYALGGAWAVSPYNLTQGFQADAPMLIQFQNNPASIIQSSEGGIDLTFAVNSGYTTITPIDGRYHPDSSVTEGWSSGLSLSVINEINFWTTRLCSFPTAVSETYAPYNSSTDTSSITETITNLSVCNIGNPFAIIPPALALSKGSLGVTFSGNVIDASYPTEFGPIMGIDGTNTYTWSVSGLKKYTDSTRVLTNPNAAPSSLVSELQSQVDKITQSGHYAPWLFNDMFPESDYITDTYFTNPADILITLSDLVSVLPDPEKTNLLNYLRTERTTYPPETVYNLPLSTGTVRNYFSVPPNTNFNGTTAANWISTNEPFLFLTKVPLYNFYALAKYYQVTQDVIPSSVISSAKTVLNSEMSERDWASMHYFKGFNQMHTAVDDTNRTLAGLIGYIKLTESTGDNTEGLARALFAKEVVARIAMAKYPRYLYTKNIVVLPSSPSWMAQMVSNQWWQGFITNYNWTSGNDDPQQVVEEDQFGTDLYDFNGYYPPGYSTNQSASDIYYTFSTKPKLVGYLDMVPETFRLMSDYDKSDMEILYDKYTSAFPAWYAAFEDSPLGNENDRIHPVDEYQLFLADEFIKGDTPQNLALYRGIPWLISGDFFYDVKLAESIKTYDGWNWSDQLNSTPTPTATITPTPILTVIPTTTPTIANVTSVTTPIPTIFSILEGDLNNDGVVNLTDVSILLTNFNSTITTSNKDDDLNNDGSINSLDFIILLNILKANGLI